MVATLLTVLWHGLLLGLILQVEELTYDQLGHLVRVRVRFKVRAASALHLSICAPQVSSTPPYLEAISLMASSVTWEAIGVPRYTMRLLRSSDGMSGGGPIRIPSTMMPPALDDCMATPPALISHDDSDDVGTLLRLERRTERPRTPASYTRADEPGNKPRSRRRPPRPCSIAYSATATPILLTLLWSRFSPPHYPCICISRQPVADFALETAHCSLPQVQLRRRDMLFSAAQEAISKGTRRARGLQRWNLRRSFRVRRPG